MTGRVSHRRIPAGPVAVAMVLMTCIVAEARQQYPYPAADERVTVPAGTLGAWSAPSTGATSRFGNPYAIGSATSQPGTMIPASTARQTPMQVPFSGQSFPTGAFSGAPPVGSGIPPQSGYQSMPPGVPPATLQFPNDLNSFGSIDTTQPSPVPQSGVLPGGVYPAPSNGYPPIVNQTPIPLDLDVYVPQGPTGRLMVGGTYGSDNGLVGELIIDERDFDVFRFPRRPADFGDPRAFRGAGQTLRVEVVPGAELERYLINFSDPYWLSSNISLSLSGYYFERQFLDWDEQRSGGRIGVGRALTDYLSINAGLRLESVTIDNPRLLTSPSLNATLGNSNLFLFNAGLEYDTRQSPYLLDSGSYLALTYKQAFGDYEFSRGEIDYRVQRLLFKRTATSGHHTVSYRTKLGFSGSDTPVFENYFAGGFSSLRGFDFRGVSPIEGGVRVGGEFQWLSSLEYQFPVTWDDMVSGVAFVDFGTVEESVELNSENFRVAPGVGLRVNLPFAGMSAPLAFDFAFPVNDATGDQQKTFSFLIGLVR